MVNESDKFSPTPDQAIAPDCGIVCELLERGVHAKFSLLDACDQDLAEMQEILQLCLAVEDAVAVELQ